MPRVFSFAALRPDPRYASRVAAPPYDVVNTAEARAMAAGNPYSFLHVDKAEIDCGDETPPHDPSVYAKARENLTYLEDQYALIRDEQPCLYIYRLTARGKTQTGLACCVSVEDYERGIIKKHELTRPDKEHDRVEHIMACGAHTGPIFMAVRNAADARAVLQGWIDSHAPVYDFLVQDTGVRHSMWVVDEQSAIEKITGIFEAASYFYIADGHHRTAAAAVAAKTAPGESGVFLGVIFPDDELTILDYNRVVRDLNGHTADAFLTVLGEHFDITVSETPVLPDTWEQEHTGRNAFGLYMDGQWRRLTLKTPPPNDPVDGLAVSVLQNRVLAPLLGILNPQTDTRIDFVGGARGAEGLTRRVDSGEMAAAFTLCPTSMSELMAVADTNRIMPPKSTWFEPKLYSGLLIHTF